MRACLIALATVLLPALAVAAGDDDHDDHDEGDAPAQLTIETAPVRTEIALQCRFDRECFEDEACTASGFTATLAGQAGGLTQSEMVVDAVLISDSADVPMLGAVSNDVYSLLGGPFAARHLLTVAGGSARYTVHFADGPLSVSYLGICE